jgi:hypothetical protein
MFGRNSEDAFVSRLEEDEDAIGERILNEGSPEGASEVKNLERMRNDNSEILRAGYPAARGAELMKKMSRHSNIQNQLYDFATNALDDDARHQVEQHLSSCIKCAEDLKELQHAIALLPQRTTAPSDDRDEIFWSHLAVNVEREIRQKQSKPNRFVEMFENIRSFFTLRPSYAYALGGSLATMLLALLLFRWQPTEEQQVAGILPIQNDAASMPANFNANQERVRQYFRSSRTLLVGLANVATDDAANFDVSEERMKARTLIHEARFVKTQPLNNRTERLVNNLERILIELANLDESNDISNVEIIRSGIRQENLLFKIRMAEASFDSARRVTGEKIY